MGCGLSGYRIRELGFSAIESTPEMLLRLLFLLSFHAIIITVSKEILIHTFVIFVSINYCGQH